MLLSGESADVLDCAWDWGSDARIYCALSPKNDSSDHASMADIRVGNDRRTLG